MGTCRLHAGQITKQGSECSWQLEAEVKGMSGARGPGICMAGGAEEPDWLHESRLGTFFEK